MPGPITGFNLIERYDSFLLMIPPQMMIFAAVKNTLLDNDNAIADVPNLVRVLSLWVSSHSKSTDNPAAKMHNVFSVNGFNFFVKF
jgi:hypothetical protein